MRFELRDYVFAHRGLWTPNGAPENSLSAFKAAAVAGLGIELDVRPSSNGIPVVFHDPSLERLTGQCGLVADQTASALANFQLPDGSAIPTLEEVLHIWPQDLPLLCELKIDGVTDPIVFAETVSAVLLAHTGYVAAMSFSAPCVQALSPNLMRGQLIPPFKAPETSATAFLNAIDLGACDYLAPHWSNALDFKASGRLPNHPLVVWTVTESTLAEALQPFADAQIFENFSPALARRVCRPKS